MEEIKFHFKYTPIDYGDIFKSNVWQMPHQIFYCLYPIVVLILSIIGANLARGNPSEIIFGIMIVSAFVLLMTPSLIAGKIEKYIKNMSHPLEERECTINFDGIGFKAISEEVFISWKIINEVKTTNRFIILRTNNIIIYLPKNKIDKEIITEVYKNIKEATVSKINLS